MLLEAAIPLLEDLKYAAADGFLWYEVPTKSSLLFVVQGVLVWGAPANLIPTKQSHNISLIYLN